MDKYEKYKHELISMVVRKQLDAFDLIEMIVSMKIKFDIDNNEGDLNEKR